MSIHRVADVAGVSHTTVSRVINEHPAVAPETIAKVRDAMKRIGYTPPLRRRGPRSKSRPGIRSHNIGLLIDQELGASGTIISRVLAGVEKALTQRQLRLMVSHVRGDSSVPLIIRDELIDGLLIYGQVRSPEIANVLSRYPTVWLMSRVGQGDRWGDRVSPDGQAIGLIAAEHLLKRQRKCVGVIATSPRHRAVQIRVESFLWMMRQQGVEVHEFIHDSDAESSVLNSDDGLVMDLTTKMVESKVEFDGLFVTSDKLVPAVYRGLERHGIQPMRDIDIVSCNNDPLLRGISPRPATIDLRPDHIGECAVEQLLLRFDRPLPYTRTDIRVAPLLVLPEESGKDDNAGNVAAVEAAAV